MTSLSGNSPKDSYLGILKTTDNAAISASLKVISDGDGSTTALKLSTTTVEATSLVITTAAPSSSSKVLVWNDTTGVVGQRELPIFEGITLTVSGANDPTMTHTDAVGGTTQTQFLGGNGIGVTYANDIITFAKTPLTLETISTTKTFVAADSGKTFLLDAAAIAGAVLTMPTASAGLYFDFIFSTTSATEFTFVSSDAGGAGVTNYFFGKVEVTSTTDDKRAVQVVTSATAAAAEENYDTLKIDGDSATSGGNEGDRIRLTAISSVAWLVEAYLTTSSATPSSIAVIAAS